MTFDEWWKQTKPAECDELKPYFEEAWEISAATEREACADVAGFAERWIGDWIARYGNRSVSDAIRERPNDRVEGRDAASSRRVPWNDGFGIADNEERNEMTPLELGILIHYRGSAADYRFGDFSAPAVRQTIDWFCGEAGLLEPTNRDEYPNATYRLTAKGEFLVDQLCAMPLPVSVWVMPNTN